MLQITIRNWCIFPKVIDITNGAQNFSNSVTTTVDGERFAGLNIHGFNAIKVFTEIFSHCLGHKYSIIKERHLYSRKNFHGTPENREKRESLAQRIFPCLPYSYFMDIVARTHYVSLPSHTKLYAVQKYSSWPCSYSWIAFRNS